MSRFVVRIMQIRKMLRSQTVGPDPLPVIVATLILGVGMVLVLLAFARTRQQDESLVHSWPIHLSNLWFWGIACLATGNLLWIALLANSHKARKHHNLEMHDLSVLDRHGALLLMVDPNRACIVAANAAAAAFYGYSPEQMRDLPLAAVNSNEDSPGLPPCDGTPHHLRQRAADGSLRDVEITRGPILVGNAPLEFWIVREVTAQNANERRLSLLSAALEAAANSVVITDAHGNIQWVNPAFTKLTGYCAKEVLGANPRILKSGLNGPEFYQELWTTILSGRVYHNEEVINRRKDGSLYTEQLTITPVLDEKGRPSNFIAIKMDISERKAAQHALQAERDFAHQVMESLGEGLAVIGADGRIEYINPALANMLGGTSPGIIGAPLTSILTPVDDADHAPASEQTATARYEATLQTTDDRQVFVHVTEAVHQPNGEPVRRILVLSDITQRKQIEADLASARDRAIEASRLKSEFLANMSHELRTPLNGVIGMTGILLATPLTAVQREYAETIRTSGDALLNIINEILDFSKIEAGKLDLEMMPFDLHDCIEESLDLLAPQAAEKGLELVYFIDEGVPAVVIGDATRLRQILVNLAGNAVKFTQSGEVSITTTARTKNSDTQNSDDVELLIAVKDTGIGIPPERIPALFQPFTQLDASTTRRFGGTGLGLTISKQLVEMMGGTMWVESSPGAGSTFSFTIRIRPASPELGQSRVPDVAQLAGRRLLIVDDNATNRTILAKYAQSWGMSYRQFDSGPAVLDQLRQGDHFDLAVLDMQMPTMDGLTLATEIRRLPHCAGLPLILLTSLGELVKSDAASVLAAQLAKPIKAAQLAKVLVSVLQPASGNAPPTTIPDDEPKLAARHPSRILLAEDNPVNQKVGLRILERLGYQADLVSNGLLAVEAVTRRTYDIVLMDVQMPEMDGLEAARAICAALPVERRPVIIAMTAHAMQGDREACLRSGMDDYISKPVRLETLTFALERADLILRNRRAATMDDQVSLPDRVHVESS